MKIHHLRNATFVIESNKKFILIDPMLGVKGSLPPFAYFRFKLQKNPLVELPKNSSSILDKVTHALITHSQKCGIELLTHSDHLDNVGKKFLKKNIISVVCPQADVKYMKKIGLHVEVGLEYWQAKEYLSGKITSVPAKHGHGFMHRFMANGAGFFLELPDEPTLYISGDTVLTEEVKKALKKFKPDITVVAAGNATLDFGNPILMSMEEIIEFVKLSPNKVIANHLEALNHCPITREDLKVELEKHGLSDKVLIPKDGEVMSF